MNKKFEQLGFGGASITSMKSYTQAAYLLETAYDLGIRHYDTAYSYGQGYSEVIFGKFMRRKRDNLTITTKFGRGPLQSSTKLPVQIVMPLNYWRRNWRKVQTMSPEQNTPSLQQRMIGLHELITSFETSLRRLKTDYIDYYFLHEGIPSFITEEALVYLIRLKEQGKIRYLGIGTNITFISELNSKSLLNWDVLQYEGNDYEQVDSILKKFPDKIHFHHSCLKTFSTLQGNKLESENIAGSILAECARRNVHGKIIFSTRHKETLRQNLAAFNKFI